MAAELVETNQIYARRVAAIKPQWAEQVGAHLVKRSYGEARWDERSGRAVTTETVTLYGLTLADDRVIGYERVDPDGARAWFITKALVEDAAAPQWSQRLAFLARNAAFLRGVRRMADRVRRVEIVDDEMLFDFYDQRVGRRRHLDPALRPMVEGRAPHRPRPVRSHRRVRRRFAPPCEGLSRRLDAARAACRSGAPAASRSNCRSPTGTRPVSRSTA